MIWRRDRLRSRRSGNDPEEFQEPKQQVNTLQETVESLESTIEMHNWKIEHINDYSQQVGGRAEMHGRTIGIDYRRAFEHIEFALDDLASVLQGNRSISEIRYKQLHPIREIELDVPENWRTPDERTYPGEIEREKSGRRLWIRSRIRRTLRSTVNG